MARRDNKGFSLTEVVVSVAVLLLLLSPILSQMMSSIRTQSLAKERLYALENANSVLEVVKSAEKDDIESRKGDLFDLQSIGGTEKLKSGEETCVLFIKGSGGGITRLAAGAAGEVKYNYTDYVLTDASFGKGMYKYSRVVTIDDLANKIKSIEVGGKHYNIAYGLTDSEVTHGTYGGFYFDRTNEGSFVAYKANDYSLGSKDDVEHVSAILVKEAPATTHVYSDPNAIDLGHIQDLDETRVAIVDGSSSNFDVQAEEDFYSLKLQHLKEINPNQWQRLMVSEVNESVFNTDTYNETVNKLTTIVFEAEKDASKGLMKYTITVNVSYEDFYKLPLVSTTGATSGFKDFNDTVTYRVYSQEFYTNRCPDVYLMYEPYVYNSTGTKVQYRSNDYISVDNQIKFWNNTGDEAVMPNIYVIRPDNTKFDVIKAGYESETSFASQIVTPVTTLADPDLGTDYYKHVYYTDIDTTHKWKPVTISFFQTGSNCVSDAAKMIPIYTDIPFTFDSTESNNKKLQLFKATYTSGTFPKVLGGSIGIGHYEQSKIMNISDSTREGDGRLFTATVTYRRLDKSGNVSDGYDIRFQSGKGAD